VVAAAGWTDARLAAWRQRAHGQGDEGGGRLASADKQISLSLKSEVKVKTSAGYGKFTDRFSYLEKVHRSLKGALVSR
jgi:hypothetical protein